MDQTTRQAAALDERYLMQTYGSRDTLFERGQGAWLFTPDGTRYLDFLSGIAVMPLGHADPDVTRATCDQAARITQTSNYFLCEHRGEAARLLSDLAGGDDLGWRVFFGNSGAEANECAMKAARRWGVMRKGPSCQKIVVLRGSFHGRTMETLAATAQGWLQEPFAPLPGGFVAVKREDFDALDAAVDQDTCAIMCEPIQGESGVWPLSDAYLRHMRSLADERGCLLLFDEVQTGLFRCGRPFAFQTVAAGRDGAEGPDEEPASDGRGVQAGAGVVPDIFTVAKGIASGVPCGACVARGEAALALRPGQQGSTFGGGPLAMAAARATLGKLAQGGFGARAERVGAYLRGRLAQVPYLTDVRGKGLMVGADVTDRDAHQLVDQLRLRHHVVANACNAKALRLLPPLIIGEEEVDLLVGALMELA